MDGGATSLTSIEMGLGGATPTSCISSKERREQLSNQLSKLERTEEKVDREKLREVLQRVCLHMLSEAVLRDRGGDVREHMKVLLDLSGLRVNKVVVGATREGWSSEELAEFKAAGALGGGVPQTPPAGLQALPSG